MSTFTIGVEPSAVVATFLDRIQGTEQSAGDVETLTLSVLVGSDAEWSNLLANTTTKHSIHVPVGGPAVIDVVNGPGEGTLVCSIGTVTAILVETKRNQYLTRRRSVGSCQFLITGSWA